MRSVILITALALVSAALAGVVSNDDALLAVVANRSEKLARVTEKPRAMTVALTGACSYSGATTVASGTLNVATPAGSNSPTPTPIVNPHQGAFYHVYISQSGLSVVNDGKGVFPEGTVVLKEKYSDATARTTELFTAMVKRPKGFNPDGGDWEYFVISGDAKKIIERGKIESCVNCHASYQSTDFVTREFVDHP